MGRQLDFRRTANVIVAGQRFLAHSFRVFGTVRLRGPSGFQGIRSAWPEALVEFADLIEGEPDLPRYRYRPDQVREAERVCELYSLMPYGGPEKKLTLRRARDQTPWRDLARDHLPAGAAWGEARRAHDLIVVDLMYRATGISADLLELVA